MATSATPYSYEQKIKSGKFATYSQLSNVVARPQFNQGETVSGYKDDDKRQKVRALLVVPMWQRASDRLIARTLKLSRQLVAAVRREMIAEGTHPARMEIVRTFDHAAMAPAHTYDWVGYQPGASARGGYVYDENGQIIRRSEWLRRQRQAKAKEAKKD